MPLYYNRSGSKQCGGAGFATLDTITVTEKAMLKSVTIHDSLSKFPLFQLSFYLAGQWFGIQGVGTPIYLGGNIYGWHKELNILVRPGDLIRPEVVTNVANAMVYYSLHFEVVQ